MIGTRPEERGGDRRKFHGAGLMLRPDFGARKRAIRAIAGQHDGSVRQGNVTMIRVPWASSLATSPSI